jgi:hypothetical protein
MDGWTSRGYDPASMASTKRPGCDNCEPIGLEDVAQILGLKLSYAVKLASQVGKLPEPQGVIGSSRWWWRHDIEKLRDDRAAD